MAFLGGGMMSSNPEAKKDQAGVGILFVEEEDPSGFVSVKVKALVEGGSAEKTGMIKAGDKVVRVDNQDVIGEPLSALRSMIPGPIGSYCRLGFLRGGLALNSNVAQEKSTHFDVQLLRQPTKNEKRKSVQGGQRSSASPSTAKPGPLNSAPGGSRSSLSSSVDAAIANVDRALRDMQKSDMERARRAMDFDSTRPKSESLDEKPSDVYQPRPPGISDLEGRSAETSFSSSKSIGAVASPDVSDFGSGADARKVELLERQIATLQLEKQIEEMKRLEARSNASQIESTAKEQAVSIVNQALNHAEKIESTAKEQAVSIVDQAVHEAEQKASDILGKARSEAAEILSNARRQAESMASDAPQNPPVSARIAPLESVNIMFYAELSRSTGSFSPSALIGRGGFGGVYKAERLKIGDRMMQAAIKRLDADSMQGQREFLAEIQLLGGCRSAFLLPLLGFSADQGSGDGGTPGAVCLVFPLMTGGSLQDRLFPGSEDARHRYKILTGHEGRFEVLSWLDRLHICVSCLKGLAFLHSSDASNSRPVFFHRDLKPQNILLDGHLHARLADAGLARARPSQDTHLTFTQVAATPGFADPRYTRTGLL